ncbi:MAG: ATP synthase F1 subunit epsilon [Planctomycetota bacterium]|nr:MAG: ATP synthase F1 subunit epsilon [Planctomycetota bacterium]
MPELQCIVVTPEKTLLDEQVDFVALPLYDGELGVLPGHAPMIGRLGAGELRMRIGNDVVRYYVEGGFVEVLDNVVSLVTTHAVSADELEVDEVEEELKSALAQKADSEELLEKRTREVTAARAKLRTALRAHR